jgi:flagellar hook-basal body complex protein FliE
MRIDTISQLGQMSKLRNIDNKSQDLSFNDILKQAISNTQQLQLKNSYNNYLLSTGDLDNLHSAMIDAEKADIALQFTLQIRNKIIDAYQEIMRMQI